MGFTKIRDSITQRTPKRCPRISLTPIWFKEHLFIEVLKGIALAGEPTALLKNTLFRV